MRPEKTIGYLLIISAIGVIVPYTILTITFNYPDILREETGLILTKFHAGGSALIFTWLGFALPGVPLLIAYQMMGQQLQKRMPFVKWVTTIGIISALVQMIGLLRWVFVIPVLSTQFVSAGDIATRQSIKVVFMAVHQFGGVLLGEHLGQLFTVIWTIFISVALLKVRFIPKWLAYLGYVASFIYLLGQAELFGTVIPHFPLIPIAGFLGSTLWLIWLVIVGFMFLKKHDE